MTPPEKSVTLIRPRLLRSLTVDPNPTGTRRDVPGAVAFTAAYLAALAAVGLIIVVTRIHPFGLSSRHAAEIILFLNAALAGSGGAIGGLITRNSPRRRIWLAFVYAVAALASYSALCYAATWLPFLRPAFR